MKHLFAFFFLLSPTFVIAQSCELPAAYGGLNTGSNMSILLHQDFLSNLELNTSSAYIVAITESNLVVGSKSLVDEDGEIVFQEAIAAWGDDAQTEEIDGAVSGDTILLKIVDGADLYTVNIIEIIFSVNGISVITSGSISYDCTGIILGCMDITACNYNLIANQDNGTCEFPVAYFDCAGNCILDTDNDGVCDELEIIGCLEPMACNYNPDATQVSDDCYYPVPYYNCEDECVNDTDGDGICDEFEIEGCTNIFACNYLETATNDDGSCILITASIFYNQLENILTVETQHDSLEITWLYYENVIPLEHNDTLHLLEDGVYGVLLYDPINDCGSTDTVHINVIGFNEGFDNLISLYPNPTSDYVNIELQTKAAVSIFNSMSEIIYQKTIIQEVVSVHKYPKGIYFIRIEGNGFTKTYPFIKE
tara:strand:- start:6971 stop:8239 length:1269 start_codon:yes stop_codon:yes gene_type:complete